MIELSPTTALTAYLGLTLGVLLVLWGWQQFFCKRDKINLLEEELRVCEYCSFAYLAPTGVKHSKCPQCSCLNTVKGPPRQ